MTMQCFDADAPSSQLHWIQYSDEVTSSLRAQISVRGDESEFGYQQAANYDSADLNIVDAPDGPFVVRLGVTVGEVSVRRAATLFWASRAETPILVAALQHVHSTIDHPRPFQQLAGHRLSEPRNPRPPRPLADSLFADPSST